VRDPGIAEDLTVETLWRIYRHTNSSGRRKLRCLGAADRHHWRSTISAATSERSLLRKPPERLRPIISSRRLGKDPAGISRLPAKLLVAATLALWKSSPTTKSPMLWDIGRRREAGCFRAVRILRKQLNHLGVGLE